MDKNFFDIIEFETKDKKNLVSSCVYKSQIEDIISVRFPEHKQKRCKNITTPYVVATNESYTYGKEIKRIYFESMW